MASSDHRRRLAALEGDLSTAVEAAKTFCLERIEMLMGDDDFMLVAHYNVRVHDGDSSKPTPEEAAALARYDTIGETDTQIMEISRKYGLPQAMLEWGKAWQTRY